MLTVFFASTNDVWASSDYGVSWTRILAAAPWGQRWGHGGFITSGGVLFVLGGSDLTNAVRIQTYHDLWASFDGGRQWTSCTMPTNPTDREFIRGEQGTQFTENEELIILSGYTYQTDARRDFADVWITNFSFADTEGLKRMCNWPPERDE